MSQYIVRPKADQDLDDQAYYYGTEASPELGHRFLVAAHDTFALLATQPEMGWRCRIKLPGLETLRVFRVNGFERILILYRPHPKGVENPSSGPPLLNSALGSSQPHPSNHFGFGLAAGNGPARRPAHEVIRLRPDLLR